MDVKQEKWPDNGAQHTGQHDHAIGQGQGQSLGTKVIIPNLPVRKLMPSQATKCGWFPLRPFVYTPPSTPTTHPASLGAHQPQKPGPGDKPTLPITSQAVRAWKPFETIQASSSYLQMVKN